MTNSKPSNMAKDHTSKVPRKRSAKKDVAPQGVPQTDVKATQAAIDMRWYPFTLIGVHALLQGHGVLASGLGQLITLPKPPRELMRHVHLTYAVNSQVVGSTVARSTLHEIYSRCAAASTVHASSLDDRLAAAVQTYLWPTVQQGSSGLCNPCRVEVDQAVTYLVVQATSMPAYVRTISELNQYPSLVYSLVDTHQDEPFTFVVSGDTELLKQIFDFVWMDHVEVIKSVNP